MRILQVTHRFFSRSGGGSYVIRNLSKSLQQRGHDVTIICSNYHFEQEYIGELTKTGVTVIPFQVQWNFGQFYYTKDLGKWLDQNLETFDVVHINGVRNYQNLLVIKYAKKYGVPVVMQAHGSLERIGNHKILKKLFDVISLPSLLEGTSKYIALSQSEKDAHIRMGIEASKVLIIPNGVNADDYHDLPEPGCFKRLYGIPEGKKIILYVGRIDQTKGIDLLIWAYKLILNEFEDVILVIAGSDEGYKRSLVQLVKSNDLEDDVLFIDYISEKQKLSAFIDSTVFVTPRFYGFPITFIESCACGLPIVTTDGGDYLDWIDGRVGCTTSYDEIELYQAIKKLISDDQLRAQFAYRCQQLVRKSLNWAVIVKEVESVYMKETLGVQKNEN